MPPDEQLEQVPLASNRGFPEHYPQSASGAAPKGEPTTRSRLSRVAPAAVFALLALVLSWAFRNDPQQIPRALIDEPVPEFALPPVQGRTPGLTSADLKDEVSLVNVFASWCVPCREEHPLFLRLRKEGVVPIHGINYKDYPGQAAQWLDRLGDPYTRTGADIDGLVAVEWGVYGVPNTFVVSAGGRIVYRHIGRITQKDLDAVVLPLVRQLQSEGGRGRR